MAETNIIDNILGSPIFVWIVIAVLIISIYIKKTGKTFPEVINSMVDFFKSISGGKE